MGYSLAIDVASPRHPVVLASCEKSLVEYFLTTKISTATLRRSGAFVVYIFIFRVILWGYSGINSQLRDILCVLSPYPDTAFSVETLECLVSGQCKVLVQTVPEQGKLGRRALSFCQPRVFRILYCAVCCASFACRGGCKEHLTHVNVAPLLGLNAGGGVDMRE